MGPARRGDEAPPARMASLAVVLCALAEGPGAVAVSAERKLRHRARRQRQDRAKKLRQAQREAAYVRLHWPRGVPPTAACGHIAHDENLARIWWRIGHHAGRLFAMRERVINES